MTKIFFAIGLIIKTSYFGVQPSLTEVRMLYYKAATEETQCKNLIDLLTPFNENNQLIFFGYRGATTMMMSKFISNPLSKLSYFKKGRKMLDKAIETDQNNVELRFLRFTIQTNSPAFLGYNRDIRSDRTFLLMSQQHITDTSLKNIITAYLDNYPA